ncbi:hypothetical protein [Nocardia sp. bgisy118]
MVDEIVDTELAVDDTELAADGADDGSNVLGEFGNSGSRSPMS